MRTALRLTLAAGLAGALLGLESAPPPAAAASSPLTAVTHAVGTGVTRRDTLRRPLADVAGARARSGRLPDGARDADERPAPRKVFGADDREPVYDTDLYPWSTVAKVIARFPDGLVAEGSAAMVGPTQALTAAHVVYDDVHGGWATDVEVIPGFDLGFAPFGRYVAEDIRGFAGFIDDGNYDYDVALLELDAAAGDDTGWLGLAARGDASLLDGLLNTAGYPGDLEDGEGMWYAADYAADVDFGAIYLNGTLDAARGQSGSAVWLRDGADRFVVGVLSTETSSANIATRITDEIYDSLDAWLGGGPIVDDPGGDVPDGTDYWETVEVPTKLHARLMPDEEVRYRFVLDETRRKLKFRLRGTRFEGFALVVRPDGSTFRLLPRRLYRTIENQPQLGEWLIVVKNRPDALRSRRFKLKVQVK